MRRMFRTYCIVISILTFILFGMTMAGLRMNVKLGSLFDLSYKAVLMAWIIGAVFYIGLFIYCLSNGEFKDNDFK